MAELLLFTIMPLREDKIDEICEDIKLQYELGTANCALFKMTLVPERNPPVDKAGDLCRIYKKYKEKLDSMGLKNGVLVQASIGHGWVLGEMFPYQQVVNFNNGNKVNVVCPYDDGFKDYMWDVFTKIAECNPDHIMLDDDVRLMCREGRGCGCELHMKRFNELAGTNLSREELYGIVSTINEKANEYTDIFVETQKESVLGAVRVMREAIDSVNSAIPGSYCCVGEEAEFGAEIAKLMAGKGNPVTLRINNGNYTPMGAKYISEKFWRAASQIAKVKNEVDIILAETDTCPQNRYSTSSINLHAHFTNTILEGANGAKHWITRLGAYEPESGIHYRTTLGKYKGFYQALSDIYPKLKWKGINTPLTKKANYSFNVPEKYGTGWVTCVFERLGLPVFFSSLREGIICMNGNSDKSFTDSEIKEFLSSPVIIASDTAMNLVERGFKNYLGVDVRFWQGKTPTSEKLYINGNFIKVQQKAKELVPLNDEVIVDSMVYNVKGNVEEELFPGTTIYKNKLGGTVFAFAGTPQANYNLVEAFSFLNYSRKQQLIKMLSLTEELPLYFPGDEEMYLKAAEMEGNKLFAALTNISLDNIDETKLIINRNINKIEKLMPDGSLQEIKFTKNGNEYTLSTECYTLNPLVLIME